LKGALDGMGQDNVLLQRSDELFITQTSNWHRPWTVEVKGESMRPGPYVIHEGERLASLLDRCGGIRPDGYLPALILVRQSVRKMQQQNLKRASAQLQTALTRAALMPAETKEQQQPNLQEKAAALKMLKDMITQSGHEQAIGRIVLNPHSLAELPGSTSDIALEDQDEIIIPKQPSSVNVMGEVYGATAVAYNPTLTIADYIDRAGGLTQDADTDEIFVVKANGAVVSEKAFRDSRKNRIFPMLPLVSGRLMGAYLGPGDTIYVPTKFLFVNPLQRTLDVTQIVANTAQGIAYAALLGTLLP
jgi:polysaccharide export outer membrane protein